MFYLFFSDRVRYFQCLMYGDQSDFSRFCKEVNHGIFFQEGAKKGALMGEMYALSHNIL